MLLNWGVRERLPRGCAYNSDTNTIMVHDLLFCFFLRLFLRLSEARPVVCLRGGERGTCLRPPLFGGLPLKYYAHKFSLFLLKDVLFTHVMCYKANHKQVFCLQRALLSKGPPTEIVMCRYFAFKGAPTATEICMYSAVKLHRRGP